MRFTNKLCVSYGIINKHSPFIKPTLNIYYLFCKGNRGTFELRVYSYIYSFITYSVLRKINSLFQNKLSRQCQLMFVPPYYSISYSP